jgi:hypothetical protein
VVLNLAHGQIKYYIINAAIEKFYGLYRRCIVMLMRAMEKEDIYEVLSVAESAFSDEKLYKWTVPNSNAVELSIDVGIMSYGMIRK